jgi:hypothetical protein
VRLLAAVARGLHRLVDVREEGIPLLRLHVLEPQAVIAQVETQQTPPEARAGLAEAVCLRHIHLHATTGDAVMTLAGEAITLSRWPAVGAEPHGIDHAIGVGCRAAAFEGERVQGADAMAGGGLIQRRHQGADTTFQAGAVSRLAGQALQDRLFELRGASAIPGADGGFEFGE